MENIGGYLFWASLIGVVGFAMYMIRVVKTRKADRLAEEEEDRKNNPPTALEDD